MLLTKACSYLLWHTKSLLPNIMKIKIYWLYMCCAKFFNQMKRDINFDINIAEIQVKKERETVLSTVKI